MYQILIVVGWNLLDKWECGNVWIAVRTLVNELAYDYDLWDELKWDIRGWEGKKGCCVEYNQYILFEKWHLIREMTFKGDEEREA